MQDVMGTIVTGAWSIPWSIPWAIPFGSGTLVWTPVVAGAALLVAWVTTRVWRRRRRSGPRNVGDHPAGPVMSGHKRDYEYDYFISYNAPYEAYAKLVDQALSREGARTWVQVHDSRKNTEPAWIVAEAIAKSQDFIALVSPRFLESNWTKNEVTQFITSTNNNRDAEKRRLIVLKCAEVDLNGTPLDTQYNTSLYNLESDQAKIAAIISALQGDPAEPRAARHDRFDPSVPETACVGRDAELTAIAQHFFPHGMDDPKTDRAAPAPAEPRRVLIQAGGGFGKTTLAAKFARTYRAHFVRTFWVPSEDESPLLARVQSIPLEPPPGKGDAFERASAALRDEFAGMKAPCLLLFDNVTPRTENLVTRLTQALPTNVRVLMTSRREGWDQVAKVVHAEALPPVVGARLLQELARREDQAGAISLAKALGGLPLALNHAGLYCRKRSRSFAEYEKDILKLIQVAPKDAPYVTAVYATVTQSFKLAKEQGGDAAEALVDFLSYCAADRIPRSLFEQALDSAMATDAAVEALRDVGLVRDSSPYEDGDTAISVHRLEQMVVRVDTDANERSAAVISRLMPALCEQLVEQGNPDESDRRPDARLRLQKYLPHLLQALPHLDAPDFRGSEKSDLLDDVAKLVVRYLTDQDAYVADDEVSEPYPKDLPNLLGCFYEVDPLAEPLHFLLNRMRGRDADWIRFRDACLAQDNYVLRFALADAIAGGARGDPANEIKSLIESPRTLNHFELGGYALKSVYSDLEDKRAIDKELLSKLAAHPCYPGRSILGDLMLNLVHQGQSPSVLLPPGEGANDRFWCPLWDFVAYDVNAVRAAEIAEGVGPLPAVAEPGVEPDTMRELAYRRQLERWRRELLAQLPADDPVRAVVVDYFTIGTDPERLRTALGTFGGHDRLADALRLFFGHPLWSVAEAAANVIAGFIRDAASPAERKRYIAIIVAHFEPSLPWRVRYGAMEAAYQIRLDEKPRMATFGQGVKAFYDDKTSSKLRGLCAENLLSVMLNAGNQLRLQLEAEFEPQIAAWLKDEDCWVLEHVHRYFRALHVRGVDVARFVEKPCSRLFAGLPQWWAADRATFLARIEERKKQVGVEPLQT